MSELQLPVLDRVRNRHEHDEEDQRLRQGEQTCGKERHNDVRARHRVEHDAEEHDGNRSEEELAAAELLRQRREECHGEQTDDDIDHAEERKLLCIAKHIDEIVEVEIVDDILTENEDKVRNRNPEELIILDEHGEHIFE